MRPLIIIQARENSSRLKKKILKKIDNKSIIQIQYERIQSLISNFHIIHAIPYKNYQLKKEILKFNKKIFEGKDSDVLNRFYNCAKKFGATNDTPIIRLTSDCPLLYGELIVNFYTFFTKNKYDYLSNTIVPTYPDGLDIEIFKFSFLRKAFENTISIHDKEHVTPYIKRCSKNKHNYRNSEDLSDIRITIDTNDDFLYVKKLIKKYGFHCDIKDIKNFYFENLSLNKNNHSNYRNSGSSLSNENIYWERAKKIIPGGNSLYSKRPELNAPNLWPSHYKKAKNYFIWSMGGKKLIDLSSMGVGTNILGYSNKEVDKQVIKTITKSNLTSLNSFEEVLLAEKLVELHPWASKVKFARTGAEANSIAIRIARAYAKKQEIAICGYHGWHDWYMSASINNNKFSQNLMKDVGNLGVPKSLKKFTHTFYYNDFFGLKKLVNKNKNIGIIIMEVMRNFAPKNNFLKKIRDLCNENEIVLIFDECTSGFREVYGGLHLKYKVYPDIAMFGKALGNGYAINAVIGKSHIMNMAKQTFISSTFWTERIGPTAALETLRVMKYHQSWKLISKKGKFIKKSWAKLAKKNKLSINVFGLDSIPKFILPYDDWLAYKTYITQEFLEINILATNTIYLSTVHDEDILNRYLKKLDNIFSIIFRCENGLDIYSLLKNNICADDFQRLN